jgi:hypothetical protein
MLGILGQSFYTPIDQQGAGRVAKYPVLMILFLCDASALNDWSGCISKF